MGYVLAVDMWITGSVEVSVSRQYICNGGLLRLPAEHATPSQGTG